MAERAPRQLDLFGASSLAQSPAIPAPPKQVPPKRTPPKVTTLQNGSAPSQRETPPPRGPGLGERLRRLAPGPIRSLTLTNNRTRIVSARQAGSGGLDVRIHRCFVDAPETTLQAVVSFLFSRRRGKARSQALAVIREHFDRHRPATSESQAPRRLVLRPVGDCFDLRELRDAVNHRYFGDELEVAITWGRRHNGANRRRSRRRRGCGFSIQLGSWDERRRVVRIHRCLDHPKVPRYVVESVVHHEMLHAAIPAVVVNGRRRVHTREFRRRERQFHDYDRATRWIEKNLTWLAKVRAGLS